jgi:hypothetical protein
MRGAGQQSPTRPGRPLAAFEQPELFQDREVSGHQGEVQLDARPTGFSDFELETAALLESGDHLMAEWIGRMTHETGQRVFLTAKLVRSVGLE